jgi:VCBS repeat-containing protein
VASDPDGDPLTFSGSATTSKGTLTVSSDGSFTYQPTALARDAAAKPNATEADKTASFTITAVDGYGGSVAIPVHITISPKVLVIVTAAFSGYTSSVSEGNSGITTTPLSVKLSSAPTETVTVTYKVGYSYLTPSATAGVDFVAETGTLTFAPGQTTASLPIKVYGDTTYEDNEYIQVELTGATGAILSLDGITSQYLTIKNDDTASPAATDSLWRV